MKKILISPILIFVLSIAAFAQKNESAPCPTISVTGPANITNAGETMTFTANVNKEIPLSYDWSLSGGTIIEGFKTSIIKVQTVPEDAGKEITVTVEVKGIPPNCVNKVSEKAFVAHLGVDPLVADEYGKLSNSDEKARLENIAVQLKQNNDFKAYFLIYLPKKNLAEASKKRISKIKNFLVKNQKISEERIIFFTNEADSVRIQIYLIPAGAIFTNPG